MIRLPRALSALSFALLFLAIPAARADEVVLQTDHSQVALGALAQVIGNAERVDDPFKSPDRVYLFLQEARFRMNGSYDGFLLHLELGMGPEDAVAAPNPGIALGLRDLDADIPIKGLGQSFVRVGQFKVPYGREGLTYSGSMLWTNRSIDSLAFVVGRDVGVSLNLRSKLGSVVAGVFTGGGRDVSPAHELPQKLGVPLFVARAGVGDADQDLYALSQTTRPVTKPQGAFFVNALYTSDSLVGHSSVLNVKLADKSLLLDSNWNPYIGQVATPGSWWQMGADAAVRVPLGSAQVSGEAELDWASYANAAGVLHVFGGRVQAALAISRLEFALRYAALRPDAGFANGGVPITGTALIQELTPAITYHLIGDRLKLVADLPLLFQVPVFTEPKVGSYVATDLPDEASVLAKGGTVARQNVVEGRLMLQAWF